MKTASKRHHIFHSKPKESLFFQEFFIKSWWVILFITACVISYDQANQSLSKEYNKLFCLHEKLIQEKNDALELHDDLLLQVKSQNDLAWIELTLIKGLGLVPENSTKIYFKED